MTNWLSDGKYKEHKPLGWLIKRSDPIDHRARVVFLTRQGQMVVENLKAQLYPEN
jgi:DNA-binding MarR family transcriptional regulator